MTMGNSDDENGEICLTENRRNQQAIQRAKRLQKYCEEDRKRPHHVEFMPSTEVYRIFEDFLLKKSKES